jgi:hypothetical protein
MAYLKLWSTAARQPGTAGSASAVLPCLMGAVGGTVTKVTPHPVENGLQLGGTLDMEGTYFANGPHVFTKGNRSPLAQKHGAGPAGAMCSDGGAEILQGVDAMQAAGLYDRQNAFDEAAAGFAVAAEAAATPEHGPVITIFATSPIASEDGTTTLGEVTFYRTGDVAMGLLVTIAVGGTAEEGADYLPVPSTVYLPPGEDSATLPITGIQDSVPEDYEDAEFTIVPDPYWYDVGYQPVEKLLLTAVVE